MTRPHHNLLKRCLALLLLIAVPVQAIAMYASGAVSVEHCRSAADERDSSVKSDAASMMQHGAHFPDHRSGMAVQATDLPDGAPCEVCGGDCSTNCSHCGHCASVMSPSIDAVIVYVGSSLIAYFSHKSVLPPDAAFRPPRSL